MRRHVGCVCVYCVCVVGVKGVGMWKARMQERRAHISSPAVSSPSQRWKVIGAPSSGSVAPSLHFSPAFIPAAPQHSLTIVIVTNQYGLSAPPLPPPPPPHPMLLSSFLKTDPTDGPATSVFPGPGF